MSAPVSQTPQLVEVDGPHAGRSHPLPYGSHVVGRQGRVSIRLDHGDVSRRHARLEVGPEGVLVSDAGSKNGVWSQDRRIDEPTLLGHDDVLRLGELSLRIVHPASQVTRALAAGGETTVTLDRRPPPAGPSLRSLLLPMIGVVVFGALVATMLLR
ncbi:MAG: FHA domain-containing protein [Myxococcales bacterium]|nr:FHA domain-containing protein [Myxococcales bacterium]MCB9714734.1 FHA domain-containing protein [Myxococcales bacterium]